MTGMSGGTPPTAGVQTAQASGPARSGWARALGRAALRVAVHLVAWLPFVAGAVEGIRLHWRPISDGAAIAMRSWDVLTPHGPLVGQATRLANGVYDPGPLQYWLEALPVHWDPRYGVLWGAALWCAIAASLAIEASRSAAGWFGGLAAAGAILGMVVWQPQIALQPFWNPWFGAMFFLAALAAAWAVLCGHRRWWPILVIAGSVAAQAHLVYALASAALVVLALLVGLVDAVRMKAGYRWAALGVLACAGCWSAPIIQEIHGHPGNLTLLVDNQGTGQLTGVTFGYKTVAAALQIPPLWWSPQHALGWLGAASMITHRSAGFAVAAMALTAVSLLAAIWPVRSRPLAALAGLSLLDSAAAVVTYANIPVKNTSLRTLGYLDALTYPVGVLCWFTVATATVLTAHWLVRKLRSRPGVPGPAAASPAVASPAVGSPAVASPDVASPALASPGPVLASPVPGPAMGGPEGSAPDGGASWLDGGASWPDGAASPPDGAASPPDGAASPPDGSAGAPPPPDMPAADLAALRSVRLAALSTLRIVRPVAARAALGVAALAATVVVAVASYLAVTRQAMAADAQPGDVIGVAVQQIERALPREQIALWVTDSRVSSQVPVAMGIAWELKAKGYRPELLSQHAARLLGWGYPYTGQLIPLVKVHVRSTGVKVRIAPVGWTVP
jgi:hypothetical protein